MIMDLLKKVPIWSPESKIRIACFLAGAAIMGAAWVSYPTKVETKEIEVVKIQTVEKEVVKWREVVKYKNQSTNKTKTTVVEKPTGEKTTIVETDKSVTNENSQDKSGSTTTEKKTEVTEEKTKITPTKENYSLGIGAEFDWNSKSVGVGIQGGVRLGDTPFWINGNVGVMQVFPDRKLEPKAGIGLQFKF